MGFAVQIYPRDELESEVQMNGWMYIESKNAEAFSKEFSELVDKYRI